MSCFGSRKPWGGGPSVVAARLALVEKAFCCAAKAGRAAEASRLVAGLDRASAVNARGADMVGVVWRESGDGGVVVVVVEDLW